MSLDFRQVLRGIRGADPASVPDILAAAATGIGGTDVVLYLVDFEQTTLEPLPNRAAHADLASSEDIATTMAGRAFLGQCAVTAERDRDVRVWVPILEGSDRTGVLAVSVPRADTELLDACEDLGVLAGYLIAINARSTDMYNLYRRRRSLSLAASMQWDLLPPLLLKTDRVAVAGLVEPAYEVAGDCFDYALNGPVLDVAVMDAVGHDLDSALVAALTIGCYRHNRREGRPLEYIHASLDAALARQYDSTAFSTGQLARVELDTGTLTWTNAGHPLPLLVRQGSVVGELACPPTAPWGVGTLGRESPKAVVVAREALEPGDLIVFYTDGVVDSHSPGGDQFGVDRLMDLVGQHASDQLEPEEVARRIVRAVLDHHDAPLADDATMLVVQWLGPPQ